MCGLDDVREWWLVGMSADLFTEMWSLQEMVVCNADTTDQMCQCFLIVVE